MTTQVQDVHEDVHQDVHPRRQQLSLGLAVAITLPGIPRFFRDGFKAPYADLKS